MQVSTWDKLTWAPNVDLDQPAHPRSLIRDFIVSMKRLCINGYPKCTQWRFWSDCANAPADLNLRRARMSEDMYSIFVTHIYPGHAKWLAHMWSAKPHIARKSGPSFLLKIKARITKCYRLNANALVMRSLVLAFALWNALNKVFFISSCVNNALKLQPVSWSVLIQLSREICTDMGNHISHIRKTHFFNKYMYM